MSKRRTKLRIKLQNGAEVTLTSLSGQSLKGLEVASLYHVGPEEQEIDMDELLRSGYTEETIKQMLRAFKRAFGDGK